MFHLCVATVKRLGWPAPSQATAAPIPLEREKGAGVEGSWWQVGTVANLSLLSLVPLGSSWARFQPYSLPSLSSFLIPRNLPIYNNKPHLEPNLSWRTQIATLPHLQASFPHRDHESMLPRCVH
ncbi:hypothetical protein J5N97_003218 [Dioscorea zingiberensis]|uniref:Uncharacterized protein n=1 Tax=Dioscorea zingiberensis TaxID=325984 RepID=A0A9D5D5J7_9LILI|nr:hypothetical protein J5N97_003218 [Dioscorea zingiberensis]